MKRFRQQGFLLSVAILLFLGAAVATATDIPLKNWAAPKTWTPAAAQASGGRSALVTTSYPPLPYIPLPPCRVVDTRLGSGFSGGYGPPALAAQATRAFTIGGQCGIPTDAQAVSFEFTAVNMTANGNFKAWPSGVSMPTASVLNWTATTSVIGNGIVVPVGGSPGVLDVYLNGPLSSTVDLVLDVNGFYGPTPADQNQHFTLNVNSSQGTMYLYNASSTCTGACGLYQFVGSGTAIEAQTNSTNSSDNGVVGTTASYATSAAGVLGQDGIGAEDAGCCFSAGVRGMGLNGVVGISDVTYPAAGVVGVFTDLLGGATINYGILGSSLYGVFSYGDFGGMGAKYFVEPHPTDASQVIRFIALEGAESGTYFRGTAKTVDGRAIIEVPDDFRMVTDEAGLTVQLTPVRAFAQMYVESENLNQIVVRSSRDVTFHYHVNGIRRAFKDFKAVTRGNEFMPHSPDERMPLYLTEEAKQRLIANGTYNADGTVNLATAERLGWAEAWRKQAVAAAAPPAVTRK